MNNKSFGALIATAVAALVTGVVSTDSAQAADAKACYRKSCGSSVKGHAGSCAGTKVAEITDEKACTEAGGVWVTEADAAKLKM